MKIAVLSGKGGTGKTFVSVNLAATLGKCTYMDCDVEEPNGYLFLKPEIRAEEKVTVNLPAFDAEKCDGCRACVDFCRFNALAYIMNRPVVFPEVCHPCEGCAMVCSRDAVSFQKKEVGTVYQGASGDTEFISGTMNIGEASGVPVIRRILEKSSDCDGISVIDCPPGSGCMVMETVSEADYCIIVGEPTEFGKDNMSMVFKLVKGFGKPVGAVLNKCTDGKNPSEEYCIEEGIPVLGKIPFTRNTGNLSSRGEISCLADGELKEIFISIIGNILNEMKEGVIG